MLSLEGNRLAIFISTLMLLSVLLYRETALQIWALWNNSHNPTYSHGPLLLVVCIYILFRQWRNNPDQYVLNVSYLGIVGLVGCGLIWFVANIGSVQILQMLSVVAILAFILIAGMGFRQAKPFLFPVLLIIGALPVWGELSPYLQKNTAVVSGWLTSFTIHPSIREGQVIHIPAGSFEVENGCSGLAYFIVSIIISLLFVHRHRMSFGRSLLFVFTAMVVAIISNIIRVYIIVLSGQLTNMQSYFITHEHVSLGWVIFAISISLYLWQAGRFVPVKENGGEKKEAQENKDSLYSTSLSTKQMHAEENLEDVKNQLIHTNVPSNTVLCLSMVILITAVVTGPLVNIAYRPNIVAENHFKIQLPEKVGKWKRIPYMGSYHPHLEKGDAFEEVDYFNATQNQKIYLMVNYFYSQQQGSEAVSDSNNLANGRYWSYVSTRKINVGLAGFTDIGEARIQARNGDEKLLWYWYETNNTRTSHNWQAKLQNIVGILKRQPSIKMVIMGIEPKSGISVARDQLRDFLQKIEPKLHVVAKSST